MKSKPHSRPTTKVSPPLYGSTPAAPSVPLSVYKELAAELQATRAMIEVLNSNQQQLAQQNQQIRSEIDRVVQSALHLQQLVATATELPADPSRSVPDSSEIPSPEATALASEIAARLRPSDAASAERHYTTEVPSQPQRISSTKRPKTLGGLWLLLTILAIVITAFGAGFLIMRPLLQPSR